MNTAFNRSDCTSTNYGGLFVSKPFCTDKNDSTPLLRIKLVERTPHLVSLASAILVRRRCENFDIERHFMSATSEI